MINLLIMLHLFFLISLLLLMLNFIISKKSFQDREKTSPFECGFDPISSNHIPFSIQFFLISLIFLIFDIEITILIPFIYLLKFPNLSFIYMSSIILILLILGLYIEYSEKSLDWKM
uniref:NADH-ubiquinone oxidoreductase chain 3 n=1 Tax=Monomorium pharaonis TaxID=307658 RepID=A0A7L8EYS6_MONPH|nr:NADH dehydrogenase subunit 3 [Monomorium pharaonis]QOE17535.1 NADH dehydrogenase subunit 3 [Monomorium pharaonis]